MYGTDNTYGSPSYGQLSGVSDDDPFWGMHPAPGSPAATPAAGSRSSTGGSEPQQRATGAVYGSGGPGGSAGTAGVYGSGGSAGTAGVYGSGRSARRAGPEESNGSEDPEGSEGAAGTAPGRKKRRRDPLWAKLCLILGALLMVVSGGVLVAAKVLIGKATSNITQASLLSDGAAAPVGPAGNSIKGAINMLLVGIDVRAVDGDTKGARSDTIVILHIPASHDQAYLVSIPRDLRVEIPPYPKSGYRGGTDKINGAFNGGYEGPGTELEKRARGTDLLALTINKLTGIRFNGAAIIDFVGFEAVLRELGGVDMCVDQRAESIHLGYDKNGKLIRTWFDERSERVRGLPPGGRRVVHEIGCRRMSPELALDFSRIRYGLPNTDYDRQRHQQQLIKAIAKEATSKGVLTDPGKLGRVIEAAGKAFVLDTRGVAIDDFLFTLKGVTANELMMIKTNKGTFNGGKINGVSYENLDADSVKMLAAVRDGKLFEFLLSHPAFQAT
jgi:LCP family protein required for cell wall assembly